MHLVIPKCPWTSKVQMELTNFLNGHLFSHLKILINSIYILVIDPSHTPFNIPSPPPSNIPSPLFWGIEKPTPHNPALKWILLNYLSVLHGEIPLLSDHCERAKKKKKKRAKSKNYEAGCTRTYYNCNFWILLIYLLVFCILPNTYTHPRMLKYII